jgi:Trk-type K+ transport system membrane component
MAIDVVVEVFLLGCLYPSFYIQGGRGYKKIDRVSYNMIPIMTLSLLTYFTYILIDIIIYTLESMPWSSGVF